MTSKKTKALDRATVEDVRRRLQRLRNLGMDARCPCCERLVRLRRGHISASMARTLLRIYDRAPRGEFQVRQVLARDQSGDYAKLRYWGLLRSAGRAGWWRMTALGRRFAQGDAEVPAVALTYNRRLYGLTGAPCSIADCLARGRGRSDDG